MTGFLAGLAFLLGAVAGVTMIWVQILFHESAHAIALWLLGGHVNMVQVGSGRFVWSRSYRSTRVELRPLWRHGQVQGGFGRSAGYRWRWVVVYLAGPIASTLVACGFWLLAWWALTDLPASPLAIGLMMFCASAASVTSITAIVAWWPRDARIGASTTPSDIRAIGEARSLDAAAIESSCESARLARGQHLAWDAFLAGDATLARQRLAALDYPDERVGYRDLEESVFAWITDGPAAALALLDRGADRIDVPAIENAAERRSIELTIAVNRVFFLTQDGGEQALATAQPFAERLEAEYLDDAGAVRTLGLYRLHTGRVQDGLALLGRAWRLTEPAWLRALTATYLAYGHFLAGTPTAARRFLRVAHRLHPQCAVLSRYRELIAAPTSALASS